MPRFTGSFRAPCFSNFTSFTLTCTCAFHCAGGHCPIARHVRRDCEGRRAGGRPAGGATLADAITKRECLYGVGHEEVRRHAWSAAARAGAISAEPSFLMYYTGGKHRNTTECIHRNTTPCRPDPGPDPAHQLFAHESKDEISKCSVRFIRDVYSPWTALDVVRV